MSQIQFTAKYQDRDVMVMGGWDNPLNGYFLTVFWEEPTDDDEEETAWSNFSLRTPWPDTPDIFIQQLQTMGIEPPDGFWDKVRTTKDNSIWYWANGQWTSYA